MTPTPPRARPEGAEFLASFAALQEAVSRACVRQSEWQAKVAAGIRAVLDFAAADPAAASALTIDARRNRLSERDDRHEQRVIDYFAAQLVALTPAGERFSISTDEGTIESIATTIRGHLLAGTASQLPIIAADLIYLILLPYTGSAGARHWSQASAGLD